MTDPLGPVEPKPVPSAKTVELVVDLVLTLTSFILVFIVDEEITSAMRAKLEALRLFCRALIEAAKRKGYLR